MLLLVRSRHQHLDVLADDSVGGIAEQLFTCWIEHQDHAACIDQDYDTAGRYAQWKQPRCPFPQRLFGALAGGEIVDDADENGLAFPLGLADRKVHREGRAVLATAHDFAPNADDFRFAGVEVVGKVAFFFNDTATTEIYTLSLHDALPI